MTTYAQASDQLIKERSMKGQVGSVIGTLTDKEVFVTCGGLSADMREAFTKYPERYIGQVFTAKGNNWYPSGAIRHPQFVMWRTDKEVDECRYSQIPAGVRTLMIDRYCRLCGKRISLAESDLYAGCCNICAFGIILLG